MIESEFHKVCRYLKRGFKAAYRLKGNREWITITSTKELPVMSSEDVELYEFKLIG